MPSHRHLRILLHLLLALAFVLPALAAPAQDVANALAVAAPQEMPCDDMQGGGDMNAMDGDDAMAADHAAGCDCCSVQCDLSACLGAACLFSMPAIVGIALPAAAPLPWRATPLVAHAPDRLLRPPIA